MIKTLRGNNGSFAGMGSVQVQPMPPDMSIAPFSIDALPAHEVALPVPVMLHTTGGIVHVQNPNLSDIVNMASTDSQFVFPLGSHVNHVVPTNNLSLAAGKTYDPRESQEPSTSTEQFHPFELATGISQDRPEIIMMTNFSPLFETDRGHASGEHVRALTTVGVGTHQTATGRFMDAQFNMRSLQAHRAQSHVRNLRGRYPSVDRTVIERTRAFTDGLMRLRDDASFLLNAIRMLNDDKTKLDLRHDAFTLKDPGAIGRYIAKNFDQLRSPQAANKSVDLVELLLSLGARKSYDFSDCMHDLGYLHASVRDVFSSSKIWLQTLYELKQALNHHTLGLLDIDPLHQRRDTNPSSINKPSVKYFGVAETLPSLPNVASIVNLKVAETPQAITTLQAAFTSIYQNAFFKNDEARLAALAHTISREFRYSNGLSSKQVHDSLERFYRFHVAPAGNLTLFDSVIGTFGNNISDFSDASGRSLVSLAQSRPRDGVGVLTFETKQVEGDNGTLTPGGDHVFDRVMARATSRGFDVSGCEELAETAETQLNQLLTVVDGFNLLMVPSTIDPRRPGASRDVGSNFLAHPIDLTFELVVGLVNPITGKTLPLVSNDKLGAVYSRARTDIRLKTMLFLYTMSKISRAYSNNVAFMNADKASDNTPLTDHLVNKIVSTLQQTVPETRSALQLASQRGTHTTSLTPSGIKHSLKAGTTLTSVVEKFMSSVIDWFRNKTSAIKDDRTRYGGYLDTVIMMMAFDLAIAAVARYGDQQLVGAHRGPTGFSQGQLTFVITQTTTNHRASVNELVQRLNKEGSLVRQLLTTITNALLVLGGTGRATASYFKSTQASSKLTDLLTGLDGDVEMLRLLLTEQQAMLLASTTESLVEANVEPFRLRHSTGATSRRPTYVPEVAVLDGSDVPPETQRAVFSLFASPAYSSRRASNKKIITVGIPLGMLQRLRQKVIVREQKRSSFNDRRTDIVQVTVYKIDMQHVDIVFRPIRFLFEMSRFPVRYSAARWLDVDDGSTLNDVVAAVPTRNFDQGTASSRRSPVQFNVEYASTAIAGQQGVKGAHAAFDDSSYSFLSAAQKSQILHNHVVSQLLEVYVRMMTGIDVSEDHYHVVEPPSLVDPIVAGQLVRHSMSQLAENVSVRGQALASDASPVGGVLFSSTSTQSGQHAQKKHHGENDHAPANAAGVAGHVDGAAQFKDNPGQKRTSSIAQQSAVGSTGDSLSGVGHKHVAAAASTVRTVSRLSMSASALASAPAWKKKVLVPKQFDRVFSVIVDPHDFEIDVGQTLATPYGKQALDLLIKHGEVVPSGFFINLGQFGAKQWGPLVPGRSGTSTTQADGFRFRTRDKNAGDLVADKYFVTIETFDEGDDR